MEIKSPIVVRHQLQIPVDTAFARCQELGVLSGRAQWSLVKVRAMTVSCDFHIFMVLVVLAGNPSLAYGATGCTGWSTQIRLVPYIMVLSYSNPLMAAASLHSDGVGEKLGLDRMQYTHKPRHIQNLLQREGVNITDLPFPQWLGIPVDGHRLICSCLECGLEQKDMLLLH